MARPLSDDSIEHRVRVAYVRKQALARNEIYYEVMHRLRDGWEEDGVRVPGLHFDEKGYLASAPSGPHLALIDEISKRSGLILPWLPEHLKQMSLDDVRGWHNPVFNDVPGWTLQLKARRRRSRRVLSSTTVPKQGPAQPISLKDFVPIDEEAIRKEIKKIETEMRSGHTSAWANSSLETFDTKDFKAVPVPLRQLGQRHHALDDGYFECWSVFDWHRDGIPDTEIARRLWPQLDPNDIRHRVHQRLKTAGRLIEMAYSEEPIQREKRRKQRPVPTP